MTPEVIEYGRFSDLVYELSTGTGFLTEAPIYGVTVKIAVSATQAADSDKSRLFDSEPAARAYINSHFKEMA